MFLPSFVLRQFRFEQSSLHKGSGSDIPGTPPCPNHEQTCVFWLNIRFLLNLPCFTEAATDFCENTGSHEFFGIGRKNRL